MTSDLALFIQTIIFAFKKVTDYEFKKCKYMSGIVGHDRILKRWNYVRWALLFKSNHKSPFLPRNSQFICLKRTLRKNSVNFTLVLENRAFLHWINSLSDSYTIVSLLQLVKMKAVTIKKYGIFKFKIQQLMFKVSLVVFTVLRTKIIWVLNGINCWHRQLPTSLVKRHL